VHRLCKWLGGLGLLAILGCVSDRRPNHSEHFSKPGQFNRLEGAGIENFYALGKSVFSGSTPDGDAGFATLQRLGIKTLLSVDGATPQSELAAKYGLHYVHVPIGYDGISVSNALVIVKAAQTLPGPIFVHCHHGLHRGPTAAAIVCESLSGWTPEQAEVWLHAAGTATNYPGLYRTVREFRAPTEVELRHAPTNFTSHARTSDFVNTMVLVDEHFEVLKAFQKAGFKPVPDHPDATPVNESLILYELFREAHRTKQGVERGEKFLTELSKAELSASDLHAHLKQQGTGPTSKSQAVEAAFQNINKSCISCHKTYRN
jgi:hypothetical protein